MDAGQGHPGGRLQGLRRAPPIPARGACCLASLRPSQWAKGAPQSGGASWHLCMNLRGLREPAEEGP